MEFIQLEIKVEAIRMVCQEIKHINNKEPRMAAGIVPILTCGEKTIHEIGSEGNFKEERENLKTAIFCVPLNEMFVEGRSGLSVKYCRGFCH